MRLGREMTRSWLCLLSGLFLCLPEGQAQGGPGDAPSGHGGSPVRRAESDARDAQNQKRLRGNADTLVLPGLVADRITKRVDLRAETTELEKGAIIEFLLIDQTCGRGYESLLWSFAKPSDVHRALEFIGMKSGEPYHPDALRFWPKGERVNIALQQDNASKPVRLESLILDKRTDKALEETGFLFTGSYRLPKEAPAHGGAYAADIFEPKSIASIFNMRLTVLDIPTRSPQRDVYGQLVLHPEAWFEPHTLVTLVLEQQAKDGSARAMDLKLTFQKSSAEPVVLNEAPSGKEISKGELAQALAAFGKLTEAGHDLFVQLDFTDKLTLQQARAYAHLINAIDKDAGIRVEPPMKGQLFYEAFSPRADMLDRNERFVHPWELDLKRGDDGGEPEGTLWLYRTDDNDAGDEQLTASHWPVKSSQSLADLIRSENARRQANDEFAVPAALFVYADPTMAYGKVTRFIADAFPKGNGTVYLFLQPMELTPP
ncbi:MAG: hypothetical protein ACI957_005235 [Verrucomicrobiales bacterium]|jgi:hypothetical protein